MMFCNCRCSTFPCPVCKEEYAQARCYSIDSYRYWCPTGHHVVNLEEEA